MYASAYSSKTTSKETLDSFLDDNTLNFLKKTFGLELYLNKEEWEEAIEDDEYVDKEVLVKLKEGKDSKFYIPEVLYKPHYKNLSKTEEYTKKEIHKFESLAQIVVYFLHKFEKGKKNQNPITPMIKSIYSLDSHEKLEYVLRKIENSLLYGFGNGTYYEKVHVTIKDKGIRKVPLIIKGKDGTEVYGIADVSLLLFYYVYQDEKIHFKEKFTRTKFMNWMRTAKYYIGRGLPKAWYYTKEALKIFGKFLVYSAIFSSVLGLFSLFMYCFKVSIEFILAVDAFSLVCAIAQVLCIEREQKRRTPDFMGGCSA